MHTQTHTCTPINSGLLLIVSTMPIGRGPKHCMIWNSCRGGGRGKTDKGTTTQEAWQLPERDSAHLMRTKHRHRAVQGI